MQNSLYLQKILKESVPNLANIKFDSIVSKIGDISYNARTGTITLNTVGIYHIQWWLASRCSLNPTIVFSIKSSIGDDIKGNSPTRTGVVSGIAVINVSSTPVTVTLTNTTGNEVYFCGKEPVKSMLSVSMEQTSGSSDTMFDFQIEQLTNVLRQFITYYQENIISLFVRGMYYVIGTPTSLYSSPSGAPRLFIMTDEGDIQAIPLNMITGVYAGDGSAYNPNLTYLTPSTPFPLGWDTDVITSIKSYLSVGTPVTVVFSIGNSREGFVYKNEYGILVVTADMDGAQPTFIPSTEASIIITTSALDGAKKSTPTTLKIDETILKSIKESK